MHNNKQHLHLLRCEACAISLLCFAFSFFGSIFCRRIASALRKKVLVPNLISPLDCVHPRHVITSTPISACRSYACATAMLFSFHVRSGTPPNIPASYYPPVIHHPSASRHASFSRNANPSRCALSPPESSLSLMDTHPSQRHICPARAERPHLVRCSISYPFSTARLRHTAPNPSQASRCSTPSV